MTNGIQSAAGFNAAPIGITAGGDSGPLSAVTLTTETPLTGALLKALASPDDPLVGATIKDFVTDEWRQSALEKIRELKGVDYEGSAADSLASPLGVPAWQPRYMGTGNYSPNSVNSWNAYFEKVPQWDEDRLKIFGDDPIKSIQGLIEMATGKGLKRAKHPLYGRDLGVGLIRSGVALNHFDWAGYDLGVPVKGHIGLVLMLDAGPGATQRAWRHQAEQNEETGNYPVEDFVLDERLCPFIDIPTPVGALSLLSARYTHMVIDDPARRCTLAAHIAWLENDDWVIYT